MKLLFCLSFVGAVFGGIIPGSAVAFWIATATRVDGSNAEAICFVVNVVLGLTGAFAGMLLTKGVRGPSKMQVTDIVVPIFFGLLCGVGGYVWLDYALSHAQPPL